MLFICRQDSNHELITHLNGRDLSCLGFAFEPNGQTSWVASSWVDSLDKSQRDCSRVCVANQEPRRRMDSAGRGFSNPSNWTRRHRNLDAVKFPDKQSDRRLARHIHIPHVLQQISDPARWSVVLSRKA